MIGRFATPDDFRRALEARLLSHSQNHATPLQPLRIRVAVSRLFSRLFSDMNAPWVVKGGFAMELRFKPKARTTRDLDIGMLRRQSVGGDQKTLLPSRLDILNNLRETVTIEIDDGFEFRIGETAHTSEIPLGVMRYSVDARLAGRTFERFHLDLGVEEPFAVGERISADEIVLAFAQFPRCAAVVVPVLWQFADKLAVYSQPRQFGPNTRSKDLVDLVKFIDGGLKFDSALRSVIQSMAVMRDLKLSAVTIPDPPVLWSAEFAVMADTCGLSVRTPQEAIVLLRNFLDT